MKEFDDFEEFDDRVEEPVDFKPYFQKILKSWKTVLLCAFCGAVFGILMGLFTPRTYTSKAVVAPELVTRSSSGGLSSLASLAGVNINNMALTDAMHPDMYPEIIHSTNFYLKLFDLPVQVQTRDSLVHTDLYDYMLHYTKKPWYAFIMSVPFMAVEGLKSVFMKDKEEEEEGHAHVDSLRLTRQQEMIVKALSKSIIATVEKRSYVLTLKVTMQDPVIAAQLANATIDNLRDFVVSYRTEKARENADYYQKLCDETKDEYLRAQRTLAYYLDSHHKIMDKSAMVHQQQLQNEAQLRYQMYSQTAQNLMTAEAKVQQEAPVLVVIQPGIAPRVGKPSKVKLAMLWFILGALVSSLWICLKKD